MCDVLNEQIIRDVARRIAKTGRITPTAEWQLKQAKQSGALMDDVIREVGVLTGKSDTEILRLFQDAGLSGMLQDAKPLLQAGKLKTSDIVLSGAMQRTMEAAAEKCRGEIGNLTLTTAIATQQGIGFLVRMQLYQFFLMRVIQAHLSFYQDHGDLVSLIGGLYAERGSQYLDR